MEHPNDDPRYSRSGDLHLTYGEIATMPRNRLRRALRATWSTLTHPDTRLLIWVLACVVVAVIGVIARIGL